MECLSLYRVNDTQFWQCLVVQTSKTSTHFRYRLTWIHTYTEIRFVCTGRGRPTADRPTDLQEPEGSTESIDSVTVTTATALTSNGSMKSSTGWQTTPAFCAASWARIAQRRGHYNRNAKAPENAYYNERCKKLIAYVVTFTPSWLFCSFIW